MTVRVLLVSHTYAARANRAKLAALGQYVTLHALIPNRWSETLLAASAPIEAGGSYALTALPVRAAGRLFYYTYHVNDLHRLLRVTQPHIVYIEQEPGSLALAQFAWLKRQHGYKLACFTWENIARHAGLPGVERFTLARCDGVIAGNAEAMRVIHGKGFRRPVTVIPQLGVDPTAFTPQRNAALRDQWTVTGTLVGYLGRWVEAKGLWTLLRAIEPLRDVSLLLVGSGPLRAEMVAWVEQHQMRGRVRMIEGVPHDDIPRYLNVLDILVLPSLTTANWKEQFGHVVIEAMACGVPVVGSDSGAIPEVVGEAGVIFPEGDVRALQDVLMRLRDDAVERERLSRAGRARILARFTHERIAAATAEFLRSL